MNPSHFCNPELSEKLIDLGVVSEFDYTWYRDIEDDDFKLNLSIFISHGMYWEGETQQAIHWSDVCLTENVKKIWPNKTYKQILEQPKQLLSMVVLPNIYKVDWQSWLTEQLTTKV